MIFNCFHQLNQQANISLNQPSFFYLYLQSFLLYQLINSPNYYHLVLIILNSKLLLQHTPSSTNQFIYPSLQQPTCFQQQSNLSVSTASDFHTTNKMNPPLNFQQEPLITSQPTNNQRITNIRLQKELQFLRESKLQYRVDKVESVIMGLNQNQNQGNNSSLSPSLSSVLPALSSKQGNVMISYRIVIEKRQPLENELILLIPKDYPFHEPLYYYQESEEDSSQAQQRQQKQNNPNSSTNSSRSLELTLPHQLLHAQPISQLLFWMPKYKILQLVELIAIKVKQKQQQQSTIKRNQLGNLVAGKFTTSQGTALVFTVAILIRVLVALGSYSGKGDSPNLGDFQAHRNWMSITVNRDIEDWYLQPSENIWWRIDYPPIAAYLSYIFGSIYKHIQPEAMALQRGYQSPLLATFMRLSVLLVQICMVFPALYLLARQPLNSQFTITKKYSLLILVSLLLKPDLISIDHGHFQYNSLIVGLILGAFYCLLNKHYYVCCVLFTVAIHSKQMAVYYALAFFAGLIGKVISDYRGNRVKIFGQVLKFGVIVISVSLIIWLPFILTGSAHLVLEAIFPVHRGLYQLKVQNFWCISDVLMKWESKFSKEFLMFLCFAVSTLLSLPSMATMILESTKKTLIIGFYTIAMTFFMFSYHVHQKSILLPLAIAPLLIQYLGPWFVSSLMVSGMLGMYHLLKEDGQWLQYFVLVGFYVVFMESFNRITCELGRFVLEGEEKKTVAEKLHARIFSTDQSSSTFMILRMALYLIPLFLHLAELLIPPPSNLEYLHHLLFAFYSFCFNAYSLVICNGILLEYLYKRLSGKRNLNKQN